MNLVKNKNSQLLCRAAFTLAETLITIGIIGVVSALTIPNLINNYRAHKLRSQFLKSYSTIQQAFKQMEADDVSLDPSDYRFVTHNKLFYKTFMNYLNTPFDCSDNTTSKRYLPCYSFARDNTFEYKDAGYKTLDGKNKAKESYFDDGQIALQDGSLLLFQDSMVPPLVISISVDLNGYNNLPNRWGYDLFTFQFVEGEIKVMGEKGTTFTNLDKYCNKNSSNELNGIACAYKAKNDSDYFKSIIKDFK